MLGRREFFHIVAAGIFTYLFFLALKPVADPDLFWHLKNGQWMVEHRSFMGGGTATLVGPEDPFSYTAQRPSGGEYLWGMKLQWLEWLGELVLYLVYLIGGFPGLSLLRAVLITMPFVYLYIRFARAKEAGPWALLPFLVFPPFLIILGMPYTFERPQAFSFLLALLTVILLERARNRPNPEKGPWALLPVMLLWANLHGGYIVGVAIVLIYMTGEGIMTAIRRGKGATLSFFLICLLSIAVTGFRPGGYELIYEWLKGLFFGLGGGPAANMGGGPAAYLEFQPLWYLYKVYHLKWPVYITAFIGIVLLTVLLKYINIAGARSPNERKFDLTEALLTIAMGGLGLYYARGANFALVVMPFIAGRCYESMHHRAGGLAAPWIKAVPALLMSLVLIAMLAGVVGSAPWQLKPSIPDMGGGTATERWVDDIYPEGAVRFIEEQGIGGPMFNEMRWGGYLIWRLYPEHRVFIDGRAVAPGIMGLYSAVMDGLPGWEDALGSFNVNFILVRVKSLELGVVTPLVLRIIEQGPTRWRAVYMEGNAVIFLKVTEANKDLIREFAIPPDVLKALLTGP